MKWTPRRLSQKYRKDQADRSNPSDSPRKAWRISKFRFFLWFVVPAIGLIFISKLAQVPEERKQAEILHQAALAEFRGICMGNPIGRSDVTVSGAYMILPELVTNKSELTQVIFNGSQIILRPLWTRVTQLEGIVFIAEWKAPEIHVKEMTALGPEQPGAYRVSFEAILKGQACSPQRLSGWTRTVNRSELFQDSTPITPSSEPMELTLTAATTVYE